MGRKAINKVDNSINVFLVELHKAISKVGTDNLIEVFSELKNDKPSSKEEFIGEKIIEISCDHYEIKEDVFATDLRSDGVYQDFMCVVSYLLKKYAKYNQNEIAERINRHKSQISKYITRIAFLKPEDRTGDIALHKKLTLIESKLVELLKKQNVKKVKSKDNINN